MTFALPQLWAFWVNLWTAAVIQLSSAVTQKSFDIINGCCAFSTEGFLKVEFLLWASLRALPCFFFIQPLSTWLHKGFKYEDTWLLLHIRLYQIPWNVAIISVLVATEWKEATTQYFAANLSSFLVLKYGVFFMHDFFQSSSYWSFNSSVETLQKLTVRSTNHPAKTL